MPGVLWARRRTFVGVSRCSRAAIGKRAAGLYIVESGRRAYVGRCTGSRSRRPCLAAFSVAAAPTGSIRMFSKDRCRRRDDRRDLAEPADDRAAYVRVSAGGSDLAYARPPPPTRCPRRQGHERAVENPQTGAGGNITPSRPLTKAAWPAAISWQATCARAQAWLQGEACRTAPRRSGSQKPQTPQSG